MSEHNSPLDPEVRAAWSELARLGRPERGRGLNLAQLREHFAAESHFWSQPGALGVASDYAPAPEHPYPRALNEIVAACKRLALEVPGVPHGFMKLQGRVRVAAAALRHAADFARRHHPF